MVRCDQPYQPKVRANRKRRFNQSELRRQFFIIERGGHCELCGSSRELDFALTIKGRSNVWGRPVHILRPILDTSLLLCRQCFSEKLVL